MSGLREPVVHAPAVMHQRARPIQTQQLLRRVRRSASDQSHNTFPAGRRTHATRPSDRPRASRFRRARPGRAANVVAQLFIGRLTTLGRAGNRSGTGAPRDRQPLEQRPQQLHALAVRQAELLVHDRQHGMDVRARIDWPPRRGPSRSATHGGLAPPGRSCSHTPTCTSNWR